MGRFRFSNRILATWSPGLLALALVLAACGGDYTFRGSVINLPKAAPDFTLTDQRGQPFRLSDQRGKVVLLYFGYTSCTDACPAAMAHLADVRRELGSNAEGAQVVFITVDPARDTQTVLQNYVTAFDPTFAGLWGSEAELDPVIKAYGATAVRVEAQDSSSNYSMDHSSFIYIIDPAGRWRELFSYDSPAQDIASDVRHLLSNG
jgi:protein SCO1/2